MVPWSQHLEQLAPMIDARTHVTQSRRLTLYGRAVIMRTAGPTPTTVHLHCPLRDQAAFRQLDGIVPADVDTQTATATRIDIEHVGRR